MATTPEPAQETAQDPDPSSTQLRLLAGGEHAPEWGLDERTRRVGRQGVAEARAILRRVQPPEPRPAAERRAS
jgi:hypothetical protein